MTKNNSEEEGICKHYKIELKAGVSEESATEEDIIETCDVNEDFNLCASCKKYATT